MAKQKDSFEYAALVDQDPQGYAQLQNEAFRELIKNNNLIALLNERDDLEEIKNYFLEKNHGADVLKKLINDVDKHIKKCSLENPLGSDYQNIIDNPKATKIKKEFFEKSGVLGSIREIEQELKNEPPSIPNIQENILFLRESSKSINLITSLDSQKALKSFNALLDKKLLTAILAQPELSSKEFKSVLMLCSKEDMISKNDILNILEKNKHWVADLTKEEWTILFEKFSPPQEKYSLAQEGTAHLTPLKRLEKMIELNDHLSLEQAQALNKILIAEYSINKKFNPTDLQNWLEELTVRCSSPNSKEILLTPHAPTLGKNFKTDKTMATNAATEASAELEKARRTIKDLNTLVGLDMTEGVKEKTQELEVKFLNHMNAMRTHLNEIRDPVSKRNFAVMIEESQAIFNETIRNFKISEAIEANAQLTPGQFEYLGNLCEGYNPLKNLPIKKREELSKQLIRYAQENFSPQQPFIKNFIAINRFCGASEQDARERMIDNMKLIQDLEQDQEDPQEIMPFDKLIVLQQKNDTCLKSIRAAGINHPPTLEKLEGLQKKINLKIEEHANFIAAQDTVNNNWQAIQSLNKQSLPFLREKTKSFAGSDQAALQKCFELSQNYLQNPSTDNLKNVLSIQHNDSLVQYQILSLQSAILERYNTDKKHIPEKSAKVAAALKPFTDRLTKLEASNELEEKLYKKLDLTLGSLNKKIQASDRLTLRNQFGNTSSDEHSLSTSTATIPADTESIENNSSPCPSETPPSRKMK